MNWTALKDYSTYIPFGIFKDTVDLYRNRNGDISIPMSWLPNQTEYMYIKTNQ